MPLSREELNTFTREAVDPTPEGPVRRTFDNVDLTDDELVRRIMERNEQRKPTFLLRLEYERRLGQRGL
jgi:urease accessory protein UreE